MGTLIGIILPVFLVLGFGYAAAWRGVMSEAAIDGIMRFAQTIALPCLLFRAISQLDLGHTFDLRLLSSFYTGATICFVLGILGARHLFGRAWIDSIAIGFVALFSNCALLGLPLTERAFGAGNLTGNYGIISIHSPFCFGLGILTMEIVRNRGGGILQTAQAVIRAMFSNPLVIGIGLGFVVNLGGIPIPALLAESLDMIVRAAIPTALFGMGGVLMRYRPEGDLRIIAYVCGLSLLLHPTITWGMGRAVGLDPSLFRSAVLTSAMAPGISGYLFAGTYGVGKRVAASAVLIGTATSVVTAMFWLNLLT